MGSEFVEKHKKKSALAALLFIFRGRAKYVSIMLIVVLCSIPFVVSGETLNGIIELPSVAAFLRGVGLGGVVDSAMHRGSDDGLDAAMNKAARDSQQGSLWAQFLKRLNAPMPPAGAQSSMAMLRGDVKDLSGPPQLKDGAERRAPGQVSGAVNEEEKARGDTGDSVDLQNMLSGKGGVYGDMMGSAMAGSFNGQGSGPYLNRSMMNGPGLSASGGSSGMYTQVFHESASRVPVPSNPGKATSKKMGKVSGFSWKNVGYKTSKATLDFKTGSKKPMFQLAQTFAMTGTAYRSGSAALEYQAAYVGSTYDGNEVNAPILQTDAAAPVVPDNSFAGDLMNGAMSAQQDAEACQSADGVYSPKISEDAQQMDTISHSLGKPPKCCSGGVGAWNNKINRLVYYCNDYNSNSAALASACQSKGESMDCGRYSSMHINPCSKWRCWLAFLFAILFLLPILVVGSVISLLLGNATMFSKIGDIVSLFVNKLAGGK